MFEIYEGKQKRYEYTTDMSDGWNVGGGWEEGRNAVGVRAMEEYGSGFKFVCTLRIRGPGPSVCDILFAGSNESLSLWS